MKEAIALDTANAEQNAEYYYQLASYLFSKLDRRPDAVAAAKQAASISQTWAGKAYYLIGTIWSITKCNTDDPIASRAHYWVATDYMVKARNADASLAEDANKQIATYSQYYPAQGEAFMYDIVDGDSYEVSCNGLRETTTVRTQK